MPSKKEVRETIGLIKCGVCDYEKGELRKQSNHIYYYMCRCGRITPNKETGQRILMDKAAMFSPKEIEDWNDYPADKEGLRVVPVWPVNGTQEKPEPVNSEKPQEPVNGSSPLMEPPEEKPEPVNKPPPEKPAEEELPDWLRD